MAYFDSPKNKVLWEMELKDLRRRKADFEAGRLDDVGKIQKDSRMGAERRKPVTLEQLEREEAVSIKSARREKTASREKSRDMNMEKQPSRSRTPALKPTIGKGG